MVMIGRIEGANRTLGKSQGYYGLPVRDSVQQLDELPQMLQTLVPTKVDGPETPVMETVWFPTPDEIERLVAGAGIHVSLVGVAHPPISVAIGEIPK